MDGTIHTSRGHTGATWNRERSGPLLQVLRSTGRLLDPDEETRRALASGRLFSLHLHDIDAEGNDPVLVPSRPGRIDLPAIIHALDAAAFQGVRTLELKPLPRDIAPRLAQAVSLRYTWRRRA